jgi:DNA-binding beta-propeller fold protein YncE
MIDGQLFVADYNNHRVQVFDPSNGEFLCSIGDGVPGKAEGQFNQPQGLGIDSERGLLYVCEFGNKRISVFSTGDYSYRGFLGSEGTGDGEFSYPTDVCIDSFRKLAYVSDFNMHQIKILEALEE